MRSPIKLFLEPLSTSVPTFDQLLTLSEFPLRLATANYVTLPQGTMLEQSLDHYLVNIQLFEYKINNHYIVDLEILKPSFFITAMLEGCSVLYNEEGKQLSEISGNSCKLTYISPGRYQRSLLGGDHKILLLSIRPEWLITKYGALEEMQELVSHYNEGSSQIFTLPSFNMGQQLFNAITKLNAGPEGRDIDIDMHIFINDCMSRYYQKLQSKIVNVGYHENKAKEIGEYVVRNFASKIVDDEFALASYFMISNIMLTRLAKHYFGKPLHQKVIELRMLNGLKLLLSTKKTIQEIASSVGYDDPHYFSRAFKRKFGVPPNEIRLSVI